MFGVTNHGMGNSGCREEAGGRILHLWGFDASCERSLRPPGIPEMGQFGVDFERWGRIIVLM